MTEAELAEVERSLSEQFPWAKRLDVYADPVPNGVLAGCNFVVKPSDGSTPGVGYNMRKFWPVPVIDAAALRDKLAAAMARFAESDWRKEAEQG